MERTNSGKVKETGKDDDWKILSELKRLEILEFDYHKEISDFSFSSICTITSLLHLDISSCSGIKDFSPLSNLINLVTLDTSKIYAEKFPKEMKSLLVWRTFENFGKYIEEIEVKNSFPSLQQIYIEGDETLSEKSVTQMFHFPSLIILHITTCNIELDWLHSISKAKKLKKMKISSCNSLKEYFKKRKIIFSNEVEKELARQSLKSNSDQPEKDKQLEEFHPYLTEFFLHVKKKFQNAFSEYIEMVRNFVMMSEKKGDELRRELGIKFRDHPAISLLFNLFLNLSGKNHVDPIETAKAGFSVLLKKNWGFINKTVLGSPKF